MQIFLLYIFWFQLVEFKNTSKYFIWKKLYLHWMWWVLNICRLSHRFHNAIDKCCCSVTHSNSTSWYPVDCSTPGFPVSWRLHCLSEAVQTHVHWVSDTIQQSPPLSLLSPPALNPLPSALQGCFQWVGLALSIRWSKYWSFIFSMSPSSEYSGLIFFRVDCFDLLAVQGTLKSLL